MGKPVTPRRTVLRLGPCALAATSLPQWTEAHAYSGLTPTNESIIRRWYAAWEQRDWRPLDQLLAHDFTFTSANNDDHISKSEFRSRCWASQIDFMERFELLHLYGSGNEALVMYVGHTKNSRTFRNVEYVRLRSNQLEAIECYFGTAMSFPSAASST